MPTIDIAGRRFGVLTAVRSAGNGKWLFRCDCGREKEIESDAVVQGAVSSCGCGCRPWRSGYARFISVAEANGVPLDCFINRLCAGLSPEDAARRDLSWMEAVLCPLPGGLWRFFPGEVWRPVPGYEGAYEVSSRGRVKNLKRCKRSHGGSMFTIPERLLHPSRASGGRTVCLSLNGEKKTFGVHVLVAMAFVEGRTAENCVVHRKDGNVENDEASNLEWAERFYGIAQKVVQRRIIETRRKNGTWSNTPRPVELVHDGEVVAQYPSAQDAAEHEGISATTVRYQCKGCRSRRPGYQWRYAEEKEED